MHNIITLYTLIHPDSGMFLTVGAHVTLWDVIAALIPNTHVQFALGIPLHHTAPTHDAEVPQLRWRLL